MAEPLVAHTLELLAPQGAVRTRRMFVGHGFYVDELFVALIAYGRLYLKADAQTQGEFEAAGSRPFVYEGGARPVTMSYWTAPDEALESPGAMAPWARLAIAAALRARQPVSKPGRDRPPGAASRAARPTGAAPAARRPRSRR
jgi:DNA transformation protein